MSPLLSALPLLLLALATLSCYLPRLRDHARVDLLRVGLLAATLLSAAGQIFWLWDADPKRIAFGLSPWTPELFHFGPGLSIDLLGAVCALLVSLVALLGLLRAQSEEAGPGALAGPLMVSTTSLFFCLATPNPLGLVAAWLALDLALFSGAGTGRRGLLVSHLGLLMVLAGIMGLPLDVEVIGLEGVSGWTRFWLLAAGTLRMGTYPLSWSLPRSRVGRMWSACFLRLGPTIAGASLVLRIAAAPVTAAPVELRHLAPGLLAIIFGAILAWLTVERAAALDWSTTFSAGLMTLAASSGGSFGMAIAVIFLIELVVARAVLYVVDGEPGRASRWLWWLAVLGLAGLPPSLGFAGRWLLYLSFEAEGLRPLLFLVAFSSTLVAVPYGGAPGRGAMRERQRAYLGLAALLMTISLALGLRLEWLRPLFEALSTPAPELRWVDGRPSIVIALVLPLLLGVLADRIGWGRREPDLDSPRMRFLRILRLTELFDGLRTGLIGLGRILHRSLGLVEGHRTMAWTLLAGVTVGLALLAGTRPVVDAPAVAASTFGIALWIVSIGIAGVLLFVPLRLATLLTLLASYLLGSAALLIGGQASAMTTISALILPLAGLVVVAILSISLIQVGDPGDGSPMPTLLIREPGDRSEGILRWISFGIAVLIVGSVQATSLPEALSADLLRPALTLVAGGILAAIFARSTLRLAVAVLFALVGFGMVYASLDPGLVMTGGMAVFQIFFAMLASLFIGLDLDAEEAKP